MTKVNDKQKDEEVITTDEEIEGLVEQVESDGGNSEEQVEEEIEVKEDVVDWEGKYKRALADYQNLEKRSHEQRREWIAGSNRELLLRILPVLDTLMLAQAHSEDQSLKVSVQQFADILKSEGVTKINAVGEHFDPHLMEAVSTAEGEEGKVMAEMQTGYMIYDKLLRPALVTVGKGN